MSNLPEWLWPIEDEEAVQEAERLIEETHSKLRRMEADMRLQGTLSQRISEKNEKLKSSVNDKIHSFERELKHLSDSKTVAPCSHKQSHSKKLNNAKVSQDLCADQQTQFLTSRLSKAPSKVLSSTAGLDQTHNISSSQRIKDNKAETSTNDAEKVVLTARAKVQDALAIARHVSASLDQHVSASSLNSRPIPTSQMTNIGIFEVKSRADGKRREAFKPRLEQALLPSISIKRGLERQSIPPIQVSPGEKIVSSNVSVYTISHDDKEIVQLKAKVEKKTEKDSPNPSESQEAKASPSGNIKLESALAQLSKQLTEVEELREINQAQVNHVLRFLLSRVCTSSETNEKKNGEEANDDKGTRIETKEPSTSPVSISTSNSSRCPIAYDSLSRFLETYKKAAEHNMVAKKRADERRQRENVKLKQEIQSAHVTTENHLLIGPLRQAVKVKEAIHQNSAAPHNVSRSDSGSKDKIVETQKSSSVSKEVDSDKSKDMLSSKEEPNVSSPIESQKYSSYNSSLLMSEIPPGGISADEYEDDWEEEDLSGLQKPDEQVSNSLDASLQTINREEEHFPSSPRSEIKNSQHPGTDLVEVEKSPLNLNIVENASSGGESFSRPQISATFNNAPMLNQTPQHENLEGQIHQNQMQQDAKIVAEGNNPEKVLLKKKSMNSFPCVTGFGSAGEPLELVDRVPLERKNSVMQSSRECKAKRHKTMLRRIQTQLASSYSSGSDCASENEPRHPSHNGRRWDLKLREDLQLQSAMLLNCQLQDRRRSKTHESDPVKTQSHLLTQQSEVLADVEKKWQKTLDQLDQRLKSIEDNERINRIATEIKKQVSEEHNKTVITDTKVSESKEIRQLGVKAVQTEKEITTKDQIVQTSPEKPPASGKEEQQQHELLTKLQYATPLYDILGGCGIDLSSGKENGDLTAELLAYCRMGILPRPVHPEQTLAKSPSSSTISSLIQQSSIAMSLSDGELRSSASDSCSCSEGEFCLCRRQKLYPERAPPDGSLTFSDGENFLKDVSHGEILPSGMKDMRDVSYGEIADYNKQGLPPGSANLVEDRSMGSDELEWELR